MKNLLATSLLLLMAAPVFAQDASNKNDTVGMDHRPNGQTAACLEAPTRDCAFTSALQTVINEEFGIERAKVLIGVAQALIETNQKAQALEMLKQALTEARSVKIGLVTQVKIHEIAPLMADAGDVAGALALAQEIDNLSVRDNLLFEIANAAIVNGSLSGARTALKQIQNRSRAFWQELTLLSRAPRSTLTTVDIAPLVAKVQATGRSENLYRGLVQLAVIADRKALPGERNGLLSEANEMFGQVVGLQARAEATAFRLRAMVDAGMDPVFIEESYELALLHGSRLRTRQEQADFAMTIGPAEAAIGRLEAALGRLKAFEKTEDQATYLASLKVSANQGLLAVHVRETLADVAAIEGAYERDIVRLTLLKCAHENRDLELARRIVESIEDDDNQALGLALMAPMLN